MGSQELKNALRDHGLTPEEFAEVIQVDPKSVQRWLTGAATPYPRHRARIARALDCGEHDLWPEQRTQDQADAESSDAAGPASRDVSEVVGTWAYSDQESAPNLIAFISSTAGQIDVLASPDGIELNTETVDTLIQQAEAGRAVRVLARQPTRSLRPLIEHQQMELRLTQGRISHALIRAGTTMLLTFSLAGERDQPPPLLTLEQHADDGLFARLTNNFQGLWDQGHAIADVETLELNLAGTDDDDVKQEDPGSGSESDEPRGTTSTHASEPTATPTEADRGQAPRRWPRRPD
jgi:transcriptional regulator with XRE-family HTH domain